MIPFTIPAANPVTGDRAASARMPQAPGLEGFALLLAPGGEEDAAGAAAAPPLASGNADMEAGAAAEAEAADEGEEETLLPSPAEIPVGMNTLSESPRPLPLHGLAGLAASRLDADAAPPTPAADETRPPSEGAAIVEGEILMAALPARTAPPVADVEEQILSARSRTGPAPAAPSAPAATASVTMAAADPADPAAPVAHLAPASPASPAALPEPSAAARPDHSSSVMPVPAGRALAEIGTGAISVPADGTPPPDAEGVPAAASQGGMSMAPPPAAARPAGKAVVFPASVPSSPLPPAAPPPVPVLPASPVPPVAAPLPSPARPDPGAGIEAPPDRIAAAVSAPREARAVSPGVPREARAVSPGVPREAVPFRPEPVEDGPAPDTVPVFDDLLATGVTPARPQAPLAPAAETVLARMQSPLARQVAGQVMVAAAGSQAEDRLVVRLKPHGMGIIEIEVTRGRDGAPEVAMRVQNPMVLEALRSERQAMADLVSSHMKGDSLSMDLMSTPQEGRGQGEDPRPRREGAAGRSEALERPEEDADASSATNLLI